MRKLKKLQKKKKKKKKPNQTQAIPVGQDYTPRNGSNSSRTSGKSLGPIGGPGEIALVLGQRVVFVCVLSVLNHLFALPGIP